VLTLLILSIALGLLASSCGGNSSSGGGSYYSGSTPDFQLSHVTPNVVRPGQELWLRIYAEDYAIIENLHSEQGVRVGGIQDELRPWDFDFWHDGIDEYQWETKPDCEEGPCVVAKIIVSPEAEPGPCRVQVTTTSSSNVSEFGWIDRAFFVQNPIEMSRDWGDQGATYSIEIRGIYDKGAEVRFYEPGTGSDEKIVVSNTRVVGYGSEGDVIYLDMSIAADATPGKRDVVVIEHDNIGREVRTGELSEGFSVLVPPAGILPTSIHGVFPQSDEWTGDSSHRINVRIEGSGFEGARAVGFGQGIDVYRFTIVNSTQIAAVIGFRTNAMIGPRDVIVEGPHNTGVLPAGFTVIARSSDDTGASSQALTAEPVPPAPVLVEPSSATQGVTDSITIRGNGMTGTTAVDFGSGISVQSITEDGPTQITVSITVADNALPGLRDVSVTTELGAGTLNEGFTVTPASKPTPPPAPSEEVIEESSTPDETAQGMIAYWKFDESSGIEVLDAIGSNHGEIKNGANRVVGKVDGALEFDGINDYIEVSNSPELNPTDEITIEAWYKLVSFIGMGSNPIVDKGYYSHESPYYQYHLAVTGDQYRTKTAAFHFWLTLEGTKFSIYAPSESWTPDKWYHLVGTYDGSEIKLYVNGILIDSALASGTMMDYGKNLRIGSIGNITRSGIDYLPGIIDEVAIYERALTEMEIVQHHQNGLNSLHYNEN